MVIFGRDKDCCFIMGAPGKTCVWTSGDPPGQLLILPSLTQIQQPRPAKDILTGDLDPSGMKV